MKASENGTNEEEEAKDQGLKNKVEEILSLTKEMACKSTEQKKKGSSEATEVEVSRSGGSKKENDEDQEKMEQLLTASRNENKNEDGQEKCGTRSLSIPKK